MNLLHHSVPVLLGIFVFLNPFPHVTTITEVIYYLAFFAVVVIAVRREKLFLLWTPLSVPILLFVMWSFITVIFALDKAESLHDFYAHLLKYIVLYYMLINFFNSKEKFLYLPWLILVSVTIFSAVSLGYFYVWQGHDIFVRFGTGFTDSSINVMGYATVFAVLIAGQFLRARFSLWVNFLLAIAFLVNGGASVLTQSRGSIIALVISCIILVARYKKSLVAILLLISFFVALAPVKSIFDLKNISNGTRVALASYSIEVLKDYPFLGTGFAEETAFKSGGIFDREKYISRIHPDMRKYLNDYNSMLPHNMFFNFGVRVGVPGVLLIFIVFIFFVKMCLILIRTGADEFIRGWGRCCLAAFAMFFVKGLVEPITTHFVEVIYFTIFSMGTILWYLNDNGEVHTVVV